MKKMCLALFATLLTAQLQIAIAATPEFARAKEQAQKDKKLLVLDFTGSDWCPPCIMLQKEIFSTARFREYAAKNLVFLEIDFPKAKVQAPEIAVQNLELAQQFGIEIFPSIIILGSDGKKIGELLGYLPGGPDAFIAELEKLRKT